MYPNFYFAVFLQKTHARIPLDNPKYLNSFPRYVACGVKLLSRIHIAARRMGSIDIGYTHFTQKRKMHQAIDLKDLSHFIGMWRCKSIALREG